MARTDSSSSDLTSTDVAKPIDRGTSVPVRPGPRRATEAGGIGDSPWLWLLMFAAFGMFGLFAISSKYQSRQKAIEQEYQGIRHMQQDEAQRVLGGESTNGELGDGSETSLLITLRPLFLLLGAAAVCGWLALLWRSSLGGTPTRQPSTKVSP